MTHVPGVLYVFRVRVRGGWGHVQVREEIARDVFEGGG